MKSIIERRIHRLNAEFAVARQRGLSSAAFIRRAKSLTAIWLTL